MPVIDGFVHHSWRSQLDVMEYMSAGWREYLGQPLNLPEGGGHNPIPVMPMNPYAHPDGDKLATSYPEDGSPPGSSYPLMREQLLDPLDLERAVLGHDDLMHAMTNINPHLARELARAANDWTIDRWLAADERLAALILISSQMPDRAAEEIHRVGEDPRMVGVHLGGNGLSKPLGHPIYHPIYAAAAALDLPIVIHADADLVPETLTDPAAGGLPSTYAEASIFRPQSLMTHLATLVGQGVFVKYPNLKVLAVGAGVAWLPALVWRFDNEYSAYRREAPWLHEMPSDIIRRHVRVSTYPMDVAPRPEQLRKLLDAFEGIYDLLIYASGYPNWDAQMPAALDDQIPPAARDAVFHDNARDFFRWTVPSDSIVAGATTVGSMDGPVVARNDLRP